MCRTNFFNAVRLVPLACLCAHVLLLLLQGVFFSDDLTAPFQRYQQTMPSLLEEKGRSCDRLMLLLRPSRADFLSFHTRATLSGTFSQENNDMHMQSSFLCGDFLGLLSMKKYVDCFVCPVVSDYQCKDDNGWS